MIKRLFFKKIIFFYAALCVVGAFIITGSQSTSMSLAITPPESTQKNSIIFDLGDVLITTSKVAHLGFILPVIAKNPSLPYYLINCDIKKTLFDILETIPAKTVDHAYNQNKRMPQILHDWLTGASTLPELTELSTQAVQASELPSSMKALFCSIVASMFHETSLISTQVINPEMVELLTSLKTAGYRIYILSNWDPYSFPILKNKFENVFKQCDGIVISGYEKVAKPSSQIYRLLLERYGLHPSNCILIDDEPHNIAHAKHCGIDGIVHKTPVETIQELKNRSIIQ